MCENLQIGRKIGYQIILGFSARNIAFPNQAKLRKFVSLAVEVLGLNKGLVLLPL